MVIEIDSLVSPEEQRSQKNAEAIFLPPFFFFRLRFPSFVVCVAADDETFANNGRWTDDDEEEDDVDLTTDERA